MLQGTANYFCIKYWDFLKQYRPVKVEYPRSSVICLTSNIFICTNNFASLHSNNIKLRNKQTLRNGYK